jgi:hypothetical protein
MTIYGASQSSGVERRLKVEMGGDGVVLTFIDHAAKKEQGRILVQPDDLMRVTMDATPGGSTVEGVAPPHGSKMHLAVEVRHNEVLLKTRTETAEGPDIAIGLDDFQDALEGAISRA